MSEINLEQLIAWRREFHEFPEIGLVRVYDNR